jgi:hypothetical protein
MQRNPSPPPIKPTPPSSAPRSTRRRRAVVFCVVWFFAWPAVVFALSTSGKDPFPKGAGPFIAYIALLVAGSYVWLIACYGLYDTLFRMAEVRWPAAKALRQLLTSIFQILRTFGHHH